MARIAGVTTQKDAKGNITHVTINVKKHKEAVPVLQTMGLMEKTKFDMDWENAMTVEEARAASHQHIRTLWKNKK